jgi:hypothetical protein
MRAASARLFQRRQHRRKLCQNTDDPDNQAEEHNFFHGCPPNFRTPYDAIAAKDVPGQGGVEAEPPGVCQRLTCSNWTGRTCGGSHLRPAKQDCRGCSRGRPECGYPSISRATARSFSSTPAGWAWKGSSQKRRDLPYRSGRVRSWIKTAVLDSRSPCLWVSGELGPPRTTCPTVPLI